MHDLFFWRLSSAGYFLVLQSGVGQVYLFQNNRRPQEFYLKESTDSMNFVEKTNKSQRTLYFFNGRTEPLCDVQENFNIFVYLGNDH